MHVLSEITDPPGSEPGRRYQCYSIGSSEFNVVLSWMSKKGVHIIISKAKPHIKNMIETVFSDYS